MKIKLTSLAVKRLGNLGIGFAVVLLVLTLLPLSRLLSLLVVLLIAVYIVILYTLLTRKNKKVEQLQRESAERGSLLQELEAGMVCFSMSSGHEVLFVNEGMCRLCGYPLEELVGRSHVFFIVEEERDRYMYELSRQLKNQNHYQIEYSLEAKDEHPVRVLEQGHSLRKDDGTIYVQASLFDVSHYHDVKTSLYALNQRLKFNELRYEAALPYADVFMFDYLPDTKQLIYYRSLRTYFGSAMEDMVDDTIDSLLNCGIIHRNFHEDVRQIFKRIDEGAAQSETSVIITNSKGEERINQMVLIAADQTGFITRRAIGVIKDVTVQNMLERERNLNTAITAESMINFVVDMNQDTILSANEAFSRLTATSVGATYSVAYLDIIRTCIHPDDALNYLDFFNPDNLWESFENGITHKRLNYRFLGENMQYIWVECAVNMVRDSITNNLCAFFQVWDVDEEKKREYKVQMEQKYYAAMLDGTEHVYEIDFSNDVFISGTEDWETHFGVAALASYSDTMDLMEEKVVHAGDVPVYNKALSRDAILSAFEYNKAEMHCEARLFDAQSEEYRWHEITLHLFSDQETNDVKGFGYVRDIHDRKKREEELVFQSQHDGMTGLYNKRATEHMIDERIVAQNGEGLFAFFILDLDNFKAINDTFGHAYGDMVLVDTANHLRRNFRDSDIVGRIGGDEFVVFAGKLPDKKVAYQHADMLLTSCTTDYSKDGITVTVSASIGIAFYAVDGQSFRQLYKNADRALYRSKENGKACYTCFDVSMKKAESEAKKEQTPTESAPA